MGGHSYSAGRASQRAECACRGFSSKSCPNDSKKCRKEGPRIEIDNATSAWIVQVESIADRAELRPRSHINTLLWDTEDLV